MNAYEISHLLEKQRASGRSYLEFLRVSALSVGVYVLPAGGIDPQQPHGEDEVYYVIAGQARFQQGDEDRPVQPGTVLYVPAQVPHRFQQITADLTVLVFFAPAEGSQPR